MKKYFFNLPVKILCIILCVLCLFSAAVSGIGIFCLVYHDGYRTSFDKMQETILREQYSHLCHNVAYLFAEDHIQANVIFESELSYLKDEVDFDCTVSSLRTVLYSDSDESEIQKEYIASFSERVYLHPASYGGAEIVYDVEINLLNPRAGSDLETKLDLLTFFYQTRYGLIAIFCSCICGAILLLVFLCFSAGRRGENPPKIGFFDKIPLEIYLVGGFVAFLLEMEFFDLAPAQVWFCLLAAALFFLVDSFLAILFVLSFATRIKTKSLIATTFVGKIWLILKKYAHLFLRLWEDVHLVPKVVLALSGVALFNLVLASILYLPLCLIVFLIEGLMLMGFLIWYAASIQRLKKDQEIISGGKLDHRCDYERFPRGLCSLADAMNRSAEGMEKAVEEKIKSERFKTELITNVSHDIKTPLTSIINYVDLIKKEKTKNERIKEYIEVLDRQSTRLKKLTEDLVESSKAASGILPVELARCDVGVLLEQSLGEYQEAFEKRGLVPCFSLPEESIFISADGKRLWRVMDNLLRNIEKYALSGTRVYVDLTEKDGKVQIAFRNISAQALSVSGEYLSERFVRGDLSRNTEGSGLGLAIAKSLVELQKGSLTITVDGDLFKVVIEFESYQ